MSGNDYSGFPETRDATIGDIEGVLRQAIGRKVKESLGPHYEDYRVVVRLEVSVRLFSPDDDDE